MSVAAHLGIAVRDYDALIRTFIPRYEEMLDAAAANLGALRHKPTLIVDLGIGSGALASRCLAVAPRARVVGVDSDSSMMALAERRLRGRVTMLTGDFLTVPLPRCDAMVASLALHHIRTRRRKKTFYARCLAALRPGGALINADLCLSSSATLQARDQDAWRAFLQRRYSRAKARSYLKAWAKDDTYFRLTDEIDLLQSVGFEVDIPWRRDGFAVLVATKRPARSSRRHTRAVRSV